MRIRWTSIPVMAGNPAGPSAALAPKKEAIPERVKANNKKEKKTKTERAIDWLAGRNR